MELRTVDNRVFLVGLDRLYREAMKQHEGTELLACARATAAALQIGPADAPVEGYYTETAALKEYFLLLRALQATGRRRLPEVAHLASFRRLRDVTASPIFGVGEADGGCSPSAGTPLGRPSSIRNPVGPFRS